MRLRTLIALAVLVSAAVHLWLWLEGFRAVAVIGPAFLANALGGAVIAVALVVWRHWLPVLAAMGFGAATLAAFLVSVTVGLFGVQEQLLGTWQVVAAVSEILAVVLGLLALARMRREGRTMPSSQRVRT